MFHWKFDHLPDLADLLFQAAYILIGDPGYGLDLLDGFFADLDLGL